MDDISMTFGNFMNVLCEKGVKFSNLIRLISTLPLDILVDYYCNFFILMKPVE